MRQAVMMCDSVIWHATISSVWLHHVACVVCDVHTGVVVDVRAGMAAQVMEKYSGFAKDIPANTRIVEINVSGDYFNPRGMLHKLVCM